MNEVVVDVVEAFNGRSIGSYSEIALCSLAHLFRNNKVFLSSVFVVCKLTKVPYHLNFCVRSYT